MDLWKLGDDADVTQTNLRCNGNTITSKIVSFNSEKSSLFDVTLLPLHRKFEILFLKFRCDGSAVTSIRLAKLLST